MLLNKIWQKFLLLLTQKLCAASAAVQASLRTGVEFYTSHRRDTWVHWCRLCAQAQNHKSLLPVDDRRSQAHGTAATTRRKQSPGCSQDHHYLFPELFLASDCPDTYPTLERNTFPLGLNLNISLGCGLNLPLGNNLCQPLSSGFRLFWAKIH